MWVVVGVLAACSGLRVDPRAQAELTSSAFSEAARSVGAASNGAAMAADDATDVLVERRIAGANALVEAVVAVLRAARGAVPSTREPVAEHMALAHDSLDVARRLIAARRAETIWRAASHAPVLDTAELIVTEAAQLLDDCGAGRDAQADVAYDRLFLTYDRFRALAASLAAASASDPIATWIGVDARRTGRRAAAELEPQAPSRGTSAVDLASAPR